MAQAYGDLPVGALADLKRAFLIYDEDGDLDRAEKLFIKFLDDHPEPVLHLPATPQAYEYFGELEVVAWFFLGKIAVDRSDPSAARIWFEKIVKTGSRNPANSLVAATRSILRKMNASRRADHETEGRP